MSENWMIEAANLTKRYAGHTAVSDLSFTVGRGEIVGLLGPNGAGKTTTINMILGVLEPSAGTIQIEGLDIAAHRQQALQRTNFAAVYAPLPGNLTVYQNLRVFGLLFGVKSLSARLDLLLQQFDLEAFRNVKCGVLSSGEQTRVGLAKALLNRPQLLLLDEPTASLDPDTADWVRSRIERYRARRGATILLASHNMNEVERLCDRVIIMKRGLIEDDDTPDQLLARYGRDNLEEVFLDVARGRGEAAGTRETAR
jgi:ABC-2 type transport system ATP-binding protein